MDFKLKFNLDNDAFNESFSGPEWEIARILDNVGTTITDYYINGLRHGKVRDKNGNTVGSWEID